MTIHHSVHSESTLAVHPQSLLPFFSHARAPYSSTLLPSSLSPSHHSSLLSLRTCLSTQIISTAYTLHSTVPSTPSTFHLLCTFIYCYFGLAFVTQAFFPHLMTVEDGKNKVSMRICLSYRGWQNPSNQRLFNIFLLVFNVSQRITYTHRSSQVTHNTTWSLQVRIHLLCAPLNKIYRHVPIERAKRHKQDDGRIWRAVRQPGPTTTAILVVSSRQAGGQCRPWPPPSPVISSIISMCTTHPRVYTRGGNGEF